MPHELVFILIASILPASVARLWWIWWQSACDGCGNQHRTCACPATDHLMRPRR